MTASHVLALLERHGVSVAVDGDTLRLRAPAPPPADVLALAREHKPALLRLLAAEPSPRPYIDRSGTLVIPTDCNPSLQWWRGGKPVLELLDDLDAPADMRARYGHLH